MSLIRRKCKKIRYHGGGMLRRTSSPRGALCSGSTGKHLLLIPWAEACVLASKISPLSISLHGLRCQPFNYATVYWKMPTKAMAGILTIGKWFFSTCIQYIQYSCSVTLQIYNIEIQFCITWIACDMIKRFKISRNYFHFPMFHKCSNRFRLFNLHKLRVQYMYTLSPKFIYKCIRSWFL